MAGAAITFPLSIDGSVTLAVPDGLSAPREAALRGLVAGLQRIRASTIEREDSQVLFYVRLFRFVLKSNLLNTIWSGVIDAELAGDPITVSYHLGTVRFCIVATAMIVVFAAFIHSTRLDLAQSAGIGLLGWLWLFGGSYLITLVRFRWFVKRCVREGFEVWSRLARTA
jgi:hypothetical protein